MVRRIDLVEALSRVFLTFVTIFCILFVFSILGTHLLAWYFGL